jgi:hypothetical protein
VLTQNAFDALCSLSKLLPVEILCNRDGLMLMFRNRPGWPFQTERLHIAASDAQTFVEVFVMPMLSGMQVQPETVDAPSWPIEIRHDGLYPAVLVGMH